MNKFLKLSFKYFVGAHTYVSAVSVKTYSQDFESEVSMKTYIQKSEWAVSVRTYI